MIKFEILVPLLNANEPEARLVGVHVQDREKVHAGTRLFTIETTKAATDIDSPQDGFIHMLVKEGSILAVGDKIAILTDAADDTTLPLNNDLPGAMPTDPLRITKPARLLAESLGVDLSSLPADRLITEEVVRQAVSSVPKLDLSLPESDQEYLLVFGAGGHAKTIIDMIKQIGLYTIAGILDDDKALNGKQVLGIRVYGTRALFPSFIEKGVKLAANGVGGILDINVRVKVFESLEHGGFSFPAIVHPRATVEPSAIINDGVQVFANAYIGTDARLEARCMINTNAVVSHDCLIGAYSHIAPGALLAGQVHVGARTLVGMGVTTAIGVQIGKGVRVGNGAILLADVPDNTIIQAGRFWTGKTENA